MFRVGRTVFVALALCIRGGGADTRTPAAALQGGPNEALSPSFPPCEYSDKTAFG